MISLASAFRHPMHLHLVIWNRLDPVEHSGAIGALLALATGECADRILLLLRPLGREFRTYEAYRDSCAHGDLAALREVPMIDNDHTAHCELWVQCGTIDNETVRRELRRLFTTIASACFFFDHSNPLWVPLGQGITDCQYARMRQNSESVVPPSLDHAGVAQMLKLIWYRGTEEVLGWLQRIGAFVPVDPIRELMSRLCADIDLEDYELTDHPLVVNPTNYGASHLAAFSINAITRVSNLHRYGLEQYYRRNEVTRPSLMPDRDSFLALFV